MTNSQPYEKLALIYDKLMSHVNYKLWAEYIKNLFQYADRDIKKIVDISVGTGNLLPFFENGDYAYFGSDLSIHMIRQARKKNELSQKPLIVSDATNISFSSKKFDAVLFLYDSLNYLPDIKSVNKLFGEVNRILKSGGVFIFDIITDILCQTYYNNFDEKETWGKKGYQRHSYYNQKERIQYNDFTIILGDKIFIEKHCQKVYMENEIQFYLKKNNLELLAQLDDFTYLTANESSERIHFVCVKK